MKGTWRRIAAGLTLTAATVTGYALTDNLAATPADTGWGAPDTDTTVTTDEPAPSAGDDGHPDLTTQDTAWG